MKKPIRTASDAFPWIALGVIVLFLTGLGIWALKPMPTDKPAPMERVEVREPARPAPERVARKKPPRPASRPSAQPVVEAKSAAGEPPARTDEAREQDEEKRVDAFDALTDRWMEPSAKGVSMTDVQEFKEAFRQVPAARQDECIHRALNLVPDENVMLLAGILMDKTQNREIVETVYNDVLNRDEAVKTPILKQIFQDKTHPCWADTAWILDVTGQKPDSKLAP